ncbi:MAG TPA: F0F1 ATP synthase subunit gamma [Methanotrichaceae archaeon]|nr:F0F1 ATP synthase subunit gamma [Methanotrichaceae archaeon]
MEEQEVLKRKVKNASELKSLVKIMKTLSAANIREYGRAAESLAEYNRTIELGLQVVMMHRAREPEAVEQSSAAWQSKAVERSGLTGHPRMKARLGVVIFGSDQGLIGKFNEQIAGFAIDRLREIEHEDLAALAVGERVIARLEEAGLHIESHCSFSGSSLGITQVMLDVLLKVEEWRLDRGVDQIILFYNRPATGAAFDPHMVYLYPLDTAWLRSLAGKKWPSRTIPAFSMGSDELFSSLVRQYIFFSLYRAFAESLASENASRLLSMQLAEKNIEGHLSELTVQLHRQRQDAITSELMDVVTGFLAQVDEDRGG